MLYVCEDCGSVFTAPATLYEHHDELDECPAEKLSVCPYCKSYAIYEARQCDMCGEYVTEDYVVLSDGTVACSDCYTVY